MQSLWSRDRETVWAINSVGRGGRRRPEVGSRWRSYGRTVIVCQPRKLYGNARSNPRQVTHLTDRILIAWRHGKFMGAQMMWACGSRTEAFTMLDEPNCRLCQMCCLRRDGEPARVQVTIGQVVIYT